MQHDPAFHDAAAGMPAKDNGAESMQGTNGYWRQLSAEELARGEHRVAVGGLWEQLGQLQFDYMLARGLKPKHNFLDLGCGSLRGGVHFVRFLEHRRYYGVDINASLLEGGRIELARENLLDREPTLLCDDRFALERFEVRFDMALAVSVFTHLHLDQIQRCLCAVARNLDDAGVFYATYFPAPRPAWLEPLSHAQEVITHLDHDPFHQHEHDYRYLARAAGLSVDVIGDWNHPRGQHMLAFRHNKS